MKKLGWLIFALTFFGLIFFSQIALSDHRISDNDEGIYLISFHLIDNGHPAYKETFFSQPPGFILSIYPGFVLLGKSLQAARLTIGFWSVMGLLALIWIGFELGSFLIGFLAIGFLYLIPSYYRQTLIFQSDIVVGTFSLFSLAATLRFKKTKKIIWLILSTFFLNFAFWTKFDITFLPSFFVLLYLIKVNKKHILTFLLTSLLFFIFFITPFGLKEIFSNSILLRLQAVNLSSSFWLLLDYLKKDLVLLVFIASGLLLVFFRKEKTKFPLNILFLWGFFTFIFFFFYRPLFPHHLAIISIPAVLLFSYILYLFLKPYKKLFAVIILLVASIALLIRIDLIKRTPKGILYSDQKKAIEIIQKNTNPEDIVVSDEGILTAASGRFPPPELADISLVRIFSNNLSSEKFKKIITKYEPKMIVAWNGRLTSINSFDEVLKNYKKLETVSQSKEIFIRK